MQEYETFDFAGNLPKLYEQETFENLLTVQCSEIGGRHTLVDGAGHLLNIDKTKFVDCVGIIDGNCAGTCRKYRIERNSKTCLLCSVQDE